MKRTPVKEQAEIILRQRAERKEKEAKEERERQEREEKRDKAKLEQERRAEEMSKRQDLQDDGDVQEKAENVVLEDVGKDDGEDNKGQGNKDKVPQDQVDDQKKNDPPDQKKDDPPDQKKPPKPPKPPKEKKEKTLEELEKELNEIRVEEDRRIEQIKKINKLQERDAEKKKEAEKLKKKLLAKAGSNNTDYHKKKIKQEAQKRKGKQDDDDDDDDDDGDNVSIPASAKYSQAWSLFGRSELEKIRDKIEMSHDKACKALKNNKEDKEVLKTAKQACERAIEYAENNSHKVDLADLDNDDKEEVEELLSSIHDDILSIDEHLSSIDKKRAEKAAGVKPKLPTFDTGNPAAYKSFHRTFCQAMEHQSDGVKIESYKQCLQGIDKASTLRLLAGVTNRFSEVTRIMETRFGDILTLIPAERAKIERLDKAKNEKDEEHNLIVVLTYWNLLSSHNAEQHFDRNMQYLVTSKLMKEHEYDLRVYNRATTLKDYIKRLQDYLSDITENLRVNGVIKEQKTNGGNGGNGGKHTRTLSSGFEKKKKCNLCGSEDHWTSDCHTLRGKDTEGIKAVFVGKKVCYTCLKKLDSSHVRPCHQYFNKKQQKMFHRTCPCRSGLNKMLCCGGKKTGVGNNSTPGTLPAAPTTTSNNARVNMVTSDPITQNVVLNNQAGIGESVTNSQILKIKIPNTDKFVEALCIFDNQSQNCLASPELQKFMEDYKRTIFNVHTINDSSITEGGYGTLSVLANGTEYKLRALTKRITNRTVSQAEFKIPQEWRERYNLKSVETTNAGRISLVIGADCLNWFPEKICSYRGVNLEKSFFDNQLMLSGYDRDMVIKIKGVPGTSSNRVSLLPLDAKYLEVMNPQQRFLNVGLCPRHIGTPACLDCKAAVLTKTRKELHEETLLESGLSFVPDDHDTNKGHWVADPPYKEDVLAKIPTYEVETRGFMEKLAAKMRSTEEGRLYAESLDATVKRNIDSGLWAWESDLVRENEEFEDLQKVVTPINYSLKDSQSHSVRLVHNLSFSRNGRPSINEAEFCGSSLNIKLHLNLLRQRGFKFQASNDIGKFYNRIRQSEKSSRLHSFLYKKGGLLSDGKFEVLCSRVLLFGARHSQYLSNSAKIQTSEMFIKPIDAQCHEDIIASYTDDVNAHSNVSLEDLERKKKIIETGLKHGDFLLKDWVTSYDEEKEDEVNISKFNSILGIYYTPKEDHWILKANVNFSSKIRGLRSAEYQINTREELSTFLQNNKLTKVMCLAACHHLFDPLCLLLSTKALLSLLYRNLLIQCPGLEYQDPIPDHLVGDWETAIGFLLDAKLVKIPRSVLPHTYNENTEVSLCCFVDGGESAAVTRLFVRTALPTDQTGEQRYHVVSLMNSFSLGSLQNSGAPKSEITALLNGCRCIELSVRMLNHLKFSEIHLFSDSRACLASLQSFTAKLKLFFSDRCLEIQSTIQNLGIHVHYIRSDLNSANYGSKVQLKGPNPVLTEDYWTVEFLTKDTGTWPTDKYQFDNADVSSLLNPKMTIPNELQSFRVSLNNFLTDLISRYSFKTIVLILSCYYQWKRENRGQIQMSTELAKQFLFSLARPREEQVEGLKRQFLIQKRDEDTYLLSRPFTMQNKAVQRTLQLLDGDSVVGKCVLRSYHIHCCGTDRELAKIYSDGLFITGARNYLRKMQNKCKTCIRIRKLHVEQLQGESIQIEAAAFPPYYRCFTDCVGPVKIKLKRNSYQKGYILSLVCSWTRHISFTILNDLTAASFLSGILTISAQLGGSTVQHLHSDWGTNIIGIRKMEEDLEDDDELENDMDKLNRRLKSTFRANNISLHLSSPRSPWKQGQVERLHRSLKLSLKRSGLYNQSFSITQWNFILARQSQILNDRPLSVKFVNENLTTLSPNCLIFGRRQGYFPRELELNLDNQTLYSQLAKLENLIRSWRGVWNLTYLQDIQKYVTFKQKTRELEEGDVVLILDHKNSTTGYSTLAQVVEKLSVRTMKLKYIQRPAKYDPDGKLMKKATVSYLIRPVQNLVFITSEQEKPSNLDPFADDDETLRGHAVPSHNDPETVTDVEESVDGQLEDVADATQAGPADAGPDDETPNGAEENEHIDPAGGVNDEPADDTVFDEEQVLQPTRRVPLTLQVADAPEIRDIVKQRKHNKRKKKN